jgi:hypothetical protein
MAVRVSALHAGRPLSPGRFLVLVSFRDWANPRALMQLEGLGQLKNPVTSSGMEPKNFRLIAYTACPASTKCVSLIAVHSFALYTHTSSAVSSSLTAVIETRFLHRCLDILVKRYALLNPHLYQQNVCCRTCFHFTKAFVCSLCNLIYFILVRHTNIMKKLNSSVQCDWLRFSYFNCSCPYMFRSSEGHLYINTVRSHHYSTCSKS